MYHRGKQSGLLEDQVETHQALSSGINLKKGQPNHQRITASRLTSVNKKPYQPSSLEVKPEIQLKKEITSAKQIYLTAKNSRPWCSFLKRKHAEISSKKGYEKANFLKFLQKIGCKYNSRRSENCDLKRKEELMI